MGESVRARAFFFRRCALSLARRELIPLRFPRRRLPPFSAPGTAPPGRPGWCRRSGSSGRRRPEMNGREMKKRALWLQREKQRSHSLSLYLSPWRRRPGPGPWLLSGGWRCEGRCACASFFRARTEFWAIWAKLSLARLTSPNRNDASLAPPRRLSPPGGPPGPPGRAPAPPPRGRPRRGRDGE